MAEASADGSDKPGESDEEPYGGLFGAIPYALRASRSQLFKLYVIVGGLAALAVALLMTLALVSLIAQTATVAGGTLTVSRAFYVVVGLFVVGPLLAPILLVARRHRRQGSSKRYDAALALAGFVFFISLYVGLLTSIPPGQQQPVSGALAPLIELLYALPQIWGVVPPVLAALFIAVVHRLAR
jgi:uncharacterized membrane protein YuzA (DUF378 family)